MALQSSNKWKAFHFTPDLCLVDGAKPLGCKVMSHSLQVIQPLTCSGSNCIYQAGPVEVLVNGDSQDIYAVKYDNGNAVECQG